MPAGIIWSYNAMCAVPTPSTIRSDSYEVLGGRVLFKEGETGTAVFICPIPAGLGYLRSLFMTYRDGDGKLGPNEISAVLRKVSTDGEVVTVEHSLVSSKDPDAPNSGPSGWATHQSAKPGQTIAHNLDFDNNYYYVQISLKRANATNPLGFLGVSLQE